MLHVYGISEVHKRVPKAFDELNMFNFQNESGTNQFLFVCCFFLLFLHFNNILFIFFFFFFVLKAMFQDISCSKTEAFI